MYLELCYQWIKEQQYTACANRDLVSKANLFHDLVLDGFFLDASLHPGNRGLAEDNFWKAKYEEQRYIHTYTQFNVVYTSVACASSLILIASNCCSHLSCSSKM